MADCHFDEDKWIRIFNVSDPRKAVAGHTVYRVSSKVFPKDFPEACTEIVVWRRFRDFKTLHKKLVKIYNHMYKDDNFPELPKAKYFGRFEEGVIEERRQSILELLNFCGSIPSLFTSQPFVQFFEGGIPSSPSEKTVSSRQSSVVSDEVDIGIIIEDADGAPTLQQESKENQSSPNSKTTSDQEDSLGGVWLCKQPSEVEGLDNLASDEEDVESRDIQHGTVAPVMPETSSDRCSPALHSGQPEVLNTKISLDSELERHSKVSTDTDDVFGTDSLDEFVTDISESDKGASDSPSDPPQWLTRAISICSEGEDLEVLASEADAGDSCNDLGFPRAFSDQEGREMQIAKSFEPKQTDQALCLDNEPSDISSRPVLPCDSQGDKTRSESETLVAIKENESDLTTDNDNEDKKFHPTHSKSFENDVSNVNAKNEDKTRSNYQNVAPPLNSTVPNASSKGLKNVFSSEMKLKPACLQEELVHDFINISPGGGNDYLLTAAQAIRKALECEVNEKYADAFNLYKTCVSHLLIGVQGENDTKRRDAVRRKTAQYLLKAETIYNVYLADKDIFDSPSEVIETREKEPEAQSEERFKDMCLHDFKVIGIINKVMLVEHIQTQETFVIKVLHKTARCSRRDPKVNDSRRRKFPRKIYARRPFMVCLHKYFETASAIYLLVQHARGGHVWDYLSSYHFTGDKKEVSGCRNKFHDFTDQREVVHCSRSSSSSSTDSSCLLQQGSEENSLTKDHFLSDQVLDNDQDIELKERVDIVEDIENSKTCQSNCTTKQGDVSVLSMSSLTRNNELVTDGKTSRDNKDSQNSSNFDDTELRDSGTSNFTANRFQGDVETERTSNKSSLFTKLDKYFSSSNVKLSDEQIRCWTAEIILALTNLHACGIVCRDLHPDNVLLDEEGHVLLTYFGAWEDVERQLHDEAIENFYCAPEVSQSEHVSATADWWSLGALLFEMLTGNSLAVCHPWRVRSHTELQFPNHVSAEARGLIRELLQVNPMERLGGGTSGVEEIKSHAYFSGIDWASLASKS